MGNSASVKKNNTNSPGASSGKVQTPTSAGSEASNNNILKLANTPSSINGKIQSPSKSETPNSSKKLSSHSKKPHDNFRNAFLLDDDNSFQEELPDIVKVNPIPHHVLAAQSVPDSPTTQALKALEKLSVNSPPVIFDPSAFDFLEGKGQQEQEVDIRRTSLLLRFDPLCQQLQADKPKAALILKDLKEEENEVSSPLLLKLNQTIPGSPGIQITTKSVKKNEKMSVGVIQEMPMENNDIKSYENLSSQINEKQMKMDDEPENKAKNEVSRNDEVEKKLKDSEQREEALLKRITEKDKTIAKMTGVIEAYEKAIAELIAEKEQLSQNFEKELSDVKADRDTNYYHLTSLETTFSDLNIKYEKNKELLSQVKASEEKLLAERKVNGENLKLQEQRYEKMKTHAMMQLEIANQKIEDYRKQHTIETTRLKALLKKEEITRAAVSDQLQQKAKENDQLMKICDELINSQQPS
ncbi:TACC1 family protein [Megaselia abdita]